MVHFLHVWARDMSCVGIQKHFSRREGPDWRQLADVASQILPGLPESGLRPAEGQRKTQRFPDRDDFMIVAVLLFVPFLFFW